MNDTVKRLMVLALNYADAQEGFGKGELTLAQRDNTRRILEAELTRLFTPLCEAEVNAIERDAWSKYAGTPMSVNTTLPAVICRMVEESHRIGEAK